MKKLINNIQTAAATALFFGMATGTNAQAQQCKASLST